MTDSSVHRRAQEVYVEPVCCKLFALISRVRFHFRTEDLSEELKSRMRRVVLDAFRNGIERGPVEDDAELDVLVGLELSAILQLEHRDRRKLEHDQVTVKLMGPVFAILREAFQLGAMSEAETRQPGEEPRHRGTPKS